jgi:hypothetical protein
MSTLLRLLRRLCGYRAPEGCYQPERCMAAGKCLHGEPPF